LEVCPRSRRPNLCNPTPPAGVYLCISEPPQIKSERYLSAHAKMKRHPYD
jgi:hypothetical protein